MFCFLKNTDNLTKDYLFQNNIYLLQVSVKCKIVLIRFDVDSYFPEFSLTYIITWLLIINKFVFFLNKSLWHQMKHIILILLKEVTSLPSVIK